MKRSQYSMNWRARTTQILQQQPDYKNRYQLLELQLKTQGGLEVVKRIKQQNDEEIRIISDITPVHYMPVQQQSGDQLQGRTVQQQQNQLARESMMGREINHQGLISEQIFISNPDARKKYLEKIKANHDVINDINTTCNAHRIRVMVCVTMYNEARTEMQNTIDGIAKSLSNLYENNILPHQVCIVILFDGIEHIHNILDDNGKGYDNNIIPYFSQNFDKIYGHSDDIQINQSSTQKKLRYYSQTLDEQYKKYKYYKQLQNQSSPAQIKQYLSNNQLRKTYENLQKKMKKVEKLQKKTKQEEKLQKEKIQKKKSDNLTETDANILKDMNKFFEISEKYITERDNSALVYQSVYKTKIEDQDNDIENQGKQAQGPPAYQTSIYYVFKFKNGQKLSSHMWFFKGFCQELQPDYCLLMDGGAIPGEGSICKLIMAMEKDSKLGGVCGTMRIQLEKDESKPDQAMDIITKLLSQLFSIQRCQQCEYDIGHILDKQFESAFNYIHVLPGAFSAYRYAAFTQKYGTNEKSSNITDFYLKSILNTNYEHNNIQEANMFLAEDRVLSMLLFCNNYYLKYIRDSYVYVDPCLSIFSLLMQRRRWINGSWFALNYVVDTFRNKLEKSGQSPISKGLFLLSLIFAKIAQFQQYFTISFQIVWLYMIVSAIFDSYGSQVSSIMKQIIIGIYVFLILMLVFLSLSYSPGIINKINDPIQKEKEKTEIHYFFFSKFYVISTILGIISLLNAGYTMYLLFIEIIVGGKVLLFLDQPHVPPAYLYFLVLLTVIFTTVPFLLWLCFNPGMVFSVARNAINYVYYQPTYTHLFLIYSFCRIDDLSWGTKGLISDDNSNLKSDRQYQKYKFISKWIISNSILTTSIYILFYLNINLIFQILILTIAMLFTLITFIKFLGSIIYFFSYTCASCFSVESRGRIERSEVRKSSKRFYHKINALYKQTNIEEEIEGLEKDEE